MRAWRITKGVLRVLGRVLVGLCLAACVGMWLVAMIVNHSWQGPPR
jgi:hypothetical protein